MNLPNFKFTPHYVEIAGARIHYLDEGKSENEVILLLHGEPTWSFMYRNIIPGLVKKGYRVVAPDFIGFGKSDKLVNVKDYSYQLHIDTLYNFIKILKIKNITLFGYDWGGAIGLRVVSMEPEKFKRIIVANTELPVGNEPYNKVFEEVRHNLKDNKNLNIGQLVQSGSAKKIETGVIEAYNAPFPDERYMSGVRAFPALVPIQANDIEALKNKKEWEFLSTWEKPLLTMFSEDDLHRNGNEELFQNKIPGAKRQHHVLLKGAGHFFQEDVAPHVVEEIDKFIKIN